MNIHQKLTFNLFGTKLLFNPADASWHLNLPICRMQCICRMQIGRFAERYPKPDTIIYLERSLTINPTSLSKPNQIKRSTLCSTGDSLVFRGIRDSNLLRRGRSNSRSNTASRKSRRVIKRANARIIIQTRKSEKEKMRE